MMISVEYDWEREYVAAVLETDDEKLSARLDVAKAVLLSRVELLNMNYDEAKLERDALAAALAGLYKLRIERLAGGRAPAQNWALRENYLQ